MMPAELPPLDEHGLLPPGVHDCSLGEVERLFGQFQRSHRRCALFTRLAEYVGELQAAGVRCQIIIDGSFVMACIDEPGDIDLVLVLPPKWDFSADLPPYLYNVIVKRRVAKRFGFDVFAVAADTPAEAELSDFFQRIGPKWRDRLQALAHQRKGILRVNV